MFVRADCGRFFAKGIQLSARLSQRDGAAAQEQTILPPCGGEKKKNSPGAMASSPMGGPT
jgi:hypothetical protein